MLRSPGSNPQTSKKVPENQLHFLTCSPGQTQGFKSAKPSSHVRREDLLSALSARAVSGEAQGLKAQFPTLSDTKGIRLERSAAI